MNLFDAAFGGARSAMRSAERNEEQEQQIKSLLFLLEKIDRGETDEAKKFIQEKLAELGYEQ
jgi:hypothetical protein